MYIAVGVIAPNPKLFLSKKKTLPRRSIEPDFDILKNFPLDNNNRFSETRIRRKKKLSRKKEVCHRIHKAA